MNDKLEYIKMEDLKPGYLYRIHARNASYGIWLGEVETGNAFGFAISRIKFGSNYIFTEFHWDMPTFATARPLEEIERSPFDVEDLAHKLLACDGTEGYSHLKVGEKYWCVPKSEEILKYLNKYEDVARAEAECKIEEWRKELKEKREAEEDERS